MRRKKRPRMMKLSTAETTKAATTNKLGLNQAVLRKQEASAQSWPTSVETPIHTLPTAKGCSVPAELAKLRSVGVGQKIKKRKITHAGREQKKRRGRWIGRKARTKTPRQRKWGWISRALILEPFLTIRD
jgi:hypothetical protein